MDLTYFPKGSLFVCKMVLLLVVVQTQLSGSDVSAIRLGSLYFQWVCLIL